MTQLTSSFSRVRAALRYGSRTQPVRDWLILLAIFTLLLFISLGWNLWLFSQATIGNKVGSAAPIPTVTIQLDQVKTLFADRAAEQTKYIQTYRFVDPSL